VIEEKANITTNVKKQMLFELHMLGLFGDQLNILCQKFATIIINRILLIKLNK